MKIKDIRTFNRWFGKKVIHVETPHIHKKKLIEYSKKRKPLCFCIIPTNFDYIKSEFGLNLSKKQYKELLKKVYLTMKKIGVELQPHVHLCVFLKQMSDREKAKKIKEAYNFFVKDLKIKPTKIVFGWWSYDNFCKKLCKKLGMKIIDRHFHLYDREV